MGSAVAERRRQPLKKVLAGAAAACALALPTAAQPQGPANAAAPAAAPAPTSVSTSASTPAAKTPPAASAARAARSGISCLMGPERIADIGTQVVGVVSFVKVDSGDSVREGQPLVGLRAEVEQAGVMAAEVRARMDADERAAQANLDLARQRLERSVQLEQQGFVSHQASEQARAEEAVAAQKLEQARGQKLVSQRELGVVRAQLAQRTLHSPFDGIVVERFVNDGERVEDKPLLRVAMLDPLRVELVLPASRYGSLREGDTLAVQPELPNTAAVQATVTRIDKMIDGASNTFRARLKLPNPGHRLPAGARCRVELPPAAAAAAEARPQTAAQRPA